MSIAAEITLGNAPATLGDGASRSGIGATNFSGAVDGAKVTCLEILSFGTVRMASNCFNTSIFAVPAVLACFLNALRKLLIALIIVSTGITTGCVRYLCWKKTVSEILLDLVLAQ